MEKVKDSQVIFAQDMHKSHQTRLTGLSDELNEQHTNQMNILKEDYENQLSSLQETLNALQEPNADVEKAIEDEKIKLLSKIEELERLSTESKSLHENELAELKSQATAQLEELANRHQEQMDQVANDLRVGAFFFLIGVIYSLNQAEINSLKENYEKEREMMKENHKAEMDKVQAAIDEAEIKKIRQEAEVSLSIPFYIQTPRANLISFY